MIRKGSLIGAMIVVVSDIVDVARGVKNLDIIQTATGAAIGALMGTLVELSIVTDD